MSDEESPFQPGDVVRLKHDSGQVVKVGDIGIVAYHLMSVADSDEDGDPMCVWHDRDGRLCAHIIDHRILVRVLP